MIYKKFLKDMQKSIDNELEMRDNIIRNLREELDWKTGLLEKIISDAKTAKRVLKND